MRSLFTELKNKSVYFFSASLAEVSKKKIYFVTKLNFNLVKEKGLMSQFKEMILAELKFFKSCM